MSLYKKVIKPGLDILFGLLLFIPILPLLAILCLLIMLTSKGAPIFVQTRIGKGCKPFKIYKLRSMFVGADKAGPYFTAKNDPRITPLGRILRKTSLDEIPQILNVVFGQMSFIGPRPDSPVQESNYTPEEWKERHLLNPGITGLAQATVRSKTTHEERTELDLRYINKASLSLDLWILIQTVKVVLFGRNAN